MAEERDQTDLRSGDILAEWDDELYQEIYLSMLHYVEKRRKGDPEFTRKVLEEVLADAYVKQGNSWAGKSPIEDIKEAATIAAFEHFLSEWKE
ncbi:MAG: hypothetical protein ACMUHM_05710 [Thermoplasmatota archaeon]